MSGLGAELPATVVAAAGAAVAGALAAGFSDEAEAGRRSDWLQPIAKSANSKDVGTRRDLGWRRFIAFDCNWVCARSGVRHELRLTTCNTICYTLQSDQVLQAQRGREVLCHWFESGHTAETCVAATYSAHHSEPGVDATGYEPRRLGMAPAEGRSKRTLGGYCQCQLAADVRICRGRRYSR